MVQNCDIGVQCGQPVLVITPQQNVHESELSDVKMKT